jgi:DNA-binding response OmpR family regulator
MRRAQSTPATNKDAVKNRVDKSVTPRNFGKTESLPPLRVLYVEDHRDSLEVLTRFLRRWGFEVLTADTLRGGISLLKDKQFDAIISDIALPDGSGYALIREAKRGQEKVIGIALSGYDTPMDVEIGKLAGFDHHLTKPFDCDAIRSILSGVMAA